MTSLDTNILAYAYNKAATEHERASRFIKDHLEDHAFAVSEIVLVEFYNLLRNPAIFATPFSPSSAVELIGEIRANPCWKILKTTADVSERV